MLKVKIISTQINLAHVMVKGRSQTRKSTRDTNQFIRSAKTGQTKLSCQKSGKQLPRGERRGQMGREGKGRRPWAQQCPALHLGMWLHARASFVIIH